jgi:hypothetical protein
MRCHTFVTWREPIEASRYAVGPLKAAAMSEEDGGDDQSDRA